MMNDDRQQHIAIIGASNNPSKFGNKAVRAYKDMGYKVFPVNPERDEIEGLKCFPSIMDIPERVDLATIYLPPERSYHILESIARKDVKQVFFNPGSADESVLVRAKSLGLEPIEGCSIVAIGKSPSEYEN